MSIKYSSEGVVLARRNFSEADRILVIFSRHFGKLSYLAKGVRKPKSRKRGHIEVFSRIKFSSYHGKGLDIINEVEIIDSYSSIRTDLKKITLAYYFVEVIEKITQEREENENLYFFLKDYLDRLSNENKLRTLRKEFVINLLILVGFWPEEKPLFDYDNLLEKVLERKISSVNVGKKILA